MRSRDRRSGGEEPRLEETLMGIVLTVLVILLLIALLPTWPYSRGWGYTPFGGGLGLLLLIVVIILLVA